MLCFLSWTKHQFVGSRLKHHLLKSSYFTLCSIRTLTQRRCRICFLLGGLCPPLLWPWAATSWCCGGSAAEWSKTGWGPESCSCWQTAWCFYKWWRTGSWSHRRRGATCAPPDRRSWWGERAGSSRRTQTPQQWSSSQPCPVSPLLPWGRPGGTPGGRGCGPSDSSRPSLLWGAAGSLAVSEPSRTGSSRRSAAACLGRNTPCGFAGFRLKQNKTLARKGW